jgi:MFS family permease
MAPPDYKVYPRRFGVLAAFSLNNCMNACLWISFASIFAAAEEKFEVGANAINWLSLVFLLAYVPGSIATAYFLERSGLRWVVICGSLLNAACAWLRCLGCLIPSPHWAFAVVMFGQLLGAISQPVWTNGPSRISGDWFASSERDIATTVAAVSIGAHCIHFCHANTVLFKNVDRISRAFFFLWGQMSNPIGNAIGSVVPGFIVNSAAGILPWMLYQAIFATAIFVVTVFVVKDKPLTPPSASAEERVAARASLEASSAELHEADGAQSSAHSNAAEAIMRLRIDTHEMFANRNFCLLIVSFGIGLGMFNALITLIAQVSSLRAERLLDACERVTMTDLEPLRCSCVTDRQSMWLRRRRRLSCGWRAAAAGSCGCRRRVYCDGENESLLTHSKGLYRCGLWGDAIYAGITSTRQCHAVDLFFRFIGTLLDPATAR